MLGTTNTEMNALFRNIISWQNLKHTSTLKKIKLLTCTSIWTNFITSISNYLNNLPESFESKEVVEEIELLIDYYKDELD